MTPHSVGPLTRPISVDRLPPAGQEVRVEASAEEREALARDFNLPAIKRLEGVFTIEGSRTRIGVTGRVRATVTQTCVVTLEDFDSEIDEKVAVDFSPGPDVSALAEGAGDDLPDPISDGMIDLGALTAEFLALGLDPHPRKPGVEFSYDGEGAGEESPFAALGKLKPK